MLASNARHHLPMVIRIPSRLVRAQLRARNFRRHYAQQTTRSSKKSGQWLGPTVALVGTFTAASAAYMWASENEKTTQETTTRIENVTIEQPKFIPTVSEERNREILSAQHAQIKKMSTSPGVYVWGANSHRVVDPDSSETIIKQPRRLHYFDGQRLRDIKLDQTSGAAVTENGDLVQWGKGYSATDFQPVRTLIGKNLVSIRMSRDRIIGLSSSGHVYSVPISKEDQKSGPKLSESSWIPGLSAKSRISYRLLCPKLSLGEKVTSIAGGLEHVLLLTNSGRVFSAAAATEAYPSRGQLGVSGLTWATRPKGPVDICHELSIKGSKIVQIASGDLHSLLLDKDGRVLVFGDNSFGQLGLESDPASSVIDTPTMLPTKGMYSSKNYSARISSIAAGGLTSFLTVDAMPKAPVEGTSVPTKKHGDLSIDTWAFGRGIHGALGTGRWTHIQDKPCKVKALSGLYEYNERTQNLQPIRPVQLAIGATHAAAVLGNNAHPSTSRDSSITNIAWGQDTLWWGGNESLQLGTGKRSNLPTPAHILPPPDLVNASSLDEARFQIIPGKQRVECGRQVTAVYSVKA